MDTNNPITDKLWDAVRAIFFGGLAYAGLALATGKLPFFELPEAATIPLYILLYSFLGGVAYLLSALLGKYKSLSNEEELLKEKKEQLSKKEAVLTTATEAGAKEYLERVKEELQKIGERLGKLEHKDQMLEIWIKMARIPFGMVMAAAFYLVANQLISEPIINALGEEILAACAFLIAFFPKVTMEAFQGLADRLIGGKPKPELVRSAETILMRLPEK